MCVEMGITSSQSWSSEQTSPRNDIEFSGLELCFPQDILIEILSQVPASDLLNNCACVCQQWSDIISGHTLWKKKCVRDKKNLPSFTLNEVPRNFYRQIYLHDPYGRNLLKNPCGEEGLKHWLIADNQGDGWKIENPPQGADEVPKSVGSQSCFATSYGLCSKFQLIDLYQEGITEEMMKLIPVIVESGEWHAARFDCGCTYNLVVYLLDKNKGRIQCFQSGPYTEPQWTGRTWSQITNLMVHKEGTLRYIGFEHSGEDTQFWAGHYGSKMTGGYVRVKYASP